MSSPALPDRRQLLQALALAGIGLTSFNTVSASRDTITTIDHQRNSHKNFVDKVVLAGLYQPNTKINIQ